MPDLDANKTTTTSMSTVVQSFEVSPMQTDSSNGNKLTTWWNNNATRYNGYYKQIPELKKAIDALALWVVGKGFMADDVRTKVLLENIDGWGEDSAEAIFNNLIICKKVFGDAFAEVVRLEGVLINLKPLDPAKVGIVAGEDGRIDHYLYRAGGGIPDRKIQPKDMLHLCNDRFADEIHGTSVIGACQWVIDARNEAMTDFRKILHRNMFLRYMEVATENTTKLNLVKTQYANAIANGELLVLPKGTSEIKSVVPSIIDPQSWIRYLENFFYNAVGIPKVVLGGSEEFTESSAKVGYLTFEQVYSKEQRELEADLLGQLQIRITFNKPASLKNEMLSSEDKNTGQVGFQPADAQVGLGARA